MTATNSAGSAAATSNPTDVVTQSPATGPPRNTVEPSISGTPQQGLSLFADIGTWAGLTPITYTYQWVRCGADGGSADGSNCTFISAATTSSYIPSSDDVGQRLRIRVTATNSLGAQTVASNASAAVLAAGATTPQAPRNTFLPFISGTMAVGQTLFASLGGWTGTSPIAYAYEWLRCGTDGGTSSGSGCTAIAGATNSQYVLTAADLGQRLRVRVTARNSLGTANAISNPTVQVQSTAPEPTPRPRRRTPRFRRAPSSCRAGRSRSPSRASRRRIA